MDTVWKNFYNNFMSSKPKSSGWSFYGRSEELGALLEHMRNPQWFFRGRFADGGESARPH